MDRCSFLKKFTTLLSYSSAGGLDGPPKGHQKSCTILFVFWLLILACFGMISWQNLGFLSDFCFPIYEILILLSVIYHKQLWHCLGLALSWGDSRLAQWFWFKGGESVCFGGFFVCFISCFSYSELHYVIKNLRLWVKSCAKGENNLGDSRESLEPLSWI